MDQNVGQNNVPDIAPLVNRLLYGLNARVPGRSGSPGHQTGMGEEPDRSVGVKSSQRCSVRGEQCFQFLLTVLS